MRKKILIGLGVVLALLLIFIGVVVMQPTDYQIVRSATIKAPQAVLFAQVNDFHNWQAWSPWAKLDPNAKNSFEGPASGQGAIFKWSGNDQIGEGKMTILESHPHDGIVIKLDFIRPFEDTSTVDFGFVPEGGQTNVIWRMRGKHNFMSKAMCLFMNMDKMVGGDFERGLALLQTASEKQAREDQKMEDAKQPKVESDKE